MYSDVRVAGLYELLGGRGAARWFRSKLFYNHEHVTFHPKNPKIEQFCLFTFSNSNSVRFPIFTSYTGAFLLFKDAGVVLDVFLAILRDLNCKIVLEQDAPESF